MCGYTAVHKDGRTCWTLCYTIWICVLMHSICLHLLWTKTQCILCYLSLPRSAFCQWSCIQMLFWSSKTDIFCSFIAIFCKVGRFASRKAFLSLFCAKCLPFFVCSETVKACPINTWNKKSFDYLDCCSCYCYCFYYYSINRIFMKLFQIGSIALCLVVLCLPGFK